MPTDPRQRHPRVTEENLRQWLHPQSFWLFSHASRPPCRCTGGWKVPDCSGWTPKSFGLQGHDHWNGCHRGAQVQLLITGRRHRLHSLVVLDPVSNPLVVECLRGFIHDELQAHLLAPVASNDLDKAGSTTALLPKAMAMLAHIATSGDTLLFANNLPRGDGTQDQSTLSFGPKDVLLFSPRLLFGILTHHRVHIFNGDGGAWLIRIFHQQRSPRRGVSAAPTAGAPTGRSGSNQKPESPHRSSSTCDTGVQHGQGQPLPTTIAPCCIAMPPSLPHRSWTEHRAPAWHRPPQRDEALQREKKSSHRTWLGSGAAPWNQPRLPPANPSQEPACG